MAIMRKCPCGSDKEYLACCGPFIENHKSAPTPEILMRSRYTAYVKRDIAYIKRTMLGPAKRNFNEDKANTQAEQVTWLGLEILKVSPINANKGYVEFIAHFRVGGKDQIIHEVSEFHKENGKWYYFDGKYPKPGRNDPCPCGSGKKYKKCCGK